MSQNTERGHLPHLAAGDETPPPEPANPNKVTTTCHCGRIRVEMPSLPSEVNACRCSSCYRYGAMWGYFNRDDVKIFVKSDTSAAGGGDGEGIAESQVLASPTKGEEECSGLRGYVRSDSGGDGGIGFYFCDHCGCMTHWALTEKGLAFFKEQAAKKGVETPKPSIGVNCRMLSPRLLEGVGRRAGKDGDF